MNTKQLTAVLEQLGACKNEITRIAASADLQTALNETSLESLTWLAERVTAPAWAEYQRVTAPAWAEYERETAPALAEYKRVKAQALAEYETRLRQMTLNEWIELLAPATAPEEE